MQESKDATVASVVSDVIRQLKWRYIRFSSIVARQLKRRHKVCFNSGETLKYQGIA